MLEEKCMAMPVGGLADIEIEPDDTDGYCQDLCAKMFAELG